MAHAYMSRAVRSFVLLAALCHASPAPAQDALTPEDVDSLQVYLINALAASDERSYLQILTSAEVLPDPTDSNSVYDIVVRYDPERFHAAFAGLYPLTFEDQFIQWGKRIALLTRSVVATTRRYYLHDISTGRQAWMFTAEARHLYSLPSEKLPGKVSLDERSSQRRWLRLMHQAPSGTELLKMGGWLRQIRRESRESVIARLGVYTPPAAAAQ
jgi:hypothetical protein